MKRSRQAFTLIELLVVIAIIAILAAILFPVFAKARENARRASCTSNLRQIALAIAQYSQDYNELLPNTWYGANNAASCPGPPVCPTTYYKWMDVLYPYAKSEEIFVCPSATDRQMGNNCPGVNFPCSPNKYVLVWKLTANSRFMGSYIMNATHWVLGDPYDAGGNKAVAAVEDAAGTAAIVEGNGHHELSWQGPAGGTNADPFLQDFPPRIFNTPNAGAAGVLVERHNDMTNVAFYDGHAKAMKTDVLITRKPAPAYSGRFYYPMFTIQAD